MNEKWSLFSKEVPKKNVESKMSRRGFLGGIAAIAVATVAGEYFGKKTPTTRATREKEIASTESVAPQSRKTMSRDVEEPKIKESTHIEKSEIHEVAGNFELEVNRAIDALTDEGKKYLAEWLRRQKNDHIISPDEVSEFLRVEYARLAGHINNIIQKRLFNGTQNGVKRYFEKAKGNEREIKEAIAKASAKWNVPEWILFGMMAVESGGNAAARNSESSATGPMQILGPTARELGLQTSHGNDERYSYEKSVDASARYLALLYKRFKQWPLAIGAYTAGGGGMNKIISSAIKRRTILGKRPTTAQEGVNIITIASPKLGNKFSQHPVLYSFMVGMMSDIFQKELDSV